MRPQDFLEGALKDIKFRVSFPGEIVTTQEYIDEFAIKFGEHILDYHNDVTSDYLPLILEQFKKEKGL